MEIFIHPKDNIYLLVTVIVPIPPTVFGSYLKVIFVGIKY